MYNFEKTMFYIYKVFREGNTRNIPLIKRSGAVWILGNGPSLKIQLKENIDIFKRHELICVNHMADSKYFEILKPEYYVMIDPAFYQDEKQLSLYLRNIRNVTLSNLVKKVQWDMYLYLPKNAQNSCRIIEYLSENKNIKIKYISTCEFYGFQFIKKYLLDHQMCNFCCINVLVVCLYVAIHMGYTNITLFGADHTWHKNLYITDDNRVAIYDSHFYGEKKKIVLEYDLGTILRNISAALKSYYEINKYALEKCVYIYNATPGSYIDAFQRVKIF